MHTTKQTAANIIATLMHRHGITDVFVSPGTRNVPLLVAVSRIKEFRLHTVVDERSAAFMALGMALRTDKTVALICTSGTALLNYAPAIAEAYYRNIPLLILSADRPERWISQDDGQTIRQPGALANIVCASYDIPDDNNAPEFDWYVNRIVNEALIKASATPKGPVHVNVHFYEPLGTTADVELTPVQQRLVQAFELPKLIQHNDLRKLLPAAAEKKIMVVVGTQKPDGRLNNALNRLGQHGNVVIVHEAQSNVRGLDCKGNVTNVDACLASLADEERIALQPDIVVSIGGSVVSRNLKEWLRKSSSDFEHWYIGTTRDNIIIDCFKHLTLKLDVKASSFLNALNVLLNKNVSSTVDFSGSWQRLSRNVHEKTNLFLQTAPWSDFTAVNRLIAKMPAELNLQVSNGMSIRYIQGSDWSKIHRIDSNRGCSGIDGCTSTAIGASIGSNRPTLLLTGDTSALYDIGALSSGCVPCNFTMVVLNNNGGDIFRIIGNTRHLTECEELMAMPKNNMSSIRAMALANGFEYLHVRSERELNDALSTVTNGERKHPLLIEIDTSDVNNADVYLGYMKFLKQ